MSDITDLTSAATTGSTNVQNVKHHGHRHKSMADMVNDMQSGIDNAVKAGTMTADQATSLKKELADITQTLQSAQASTTGATGKTNPMSQLSEADRKKVFSELQDVRKQLHAANNPQDATVAATNSASNNAVSNLFSKLDTNNNGSIDKDEFTQFLAQVGANALGYNQQGNTNSISSVLSGSSFSIFG
jgi:polyhydroxyalkanoate synthesis regulator phasin